MLISIRLLREEAEDWELHGPRLERALQRPPSNEKVAGGESGRGLHQACSPRVHAHARARTRTQAHTAGPLPTPLLLLEAKRAQTVTSRAKGSDTESNPFRPELTGWAGL